MDIGGCGFVKGSDYMCQLPRFFSDLSAVFYSPIFAVNHCVADYLHLFNLKVKRV